MHDEPDLGPWQEPLADEDFEDDGDGECFCAMSMRNATGQSGSAAVERWLRMPHHYSLREYLDEQKQRAADNKEETAKNRRTRWASLNFRF